MRPASRRRTITVVGVSAGVHLAVLTALALYAPSLRPPPVPSGPPEPIIPVLIVPRLPPPEAGGPPRPIRLHRRPQRFAPSELPVPPLVAPETEPQPRAREDAPVRLTPPEADPVAANVRQALRGSLVGCANARTLGLSRDEREECENALARGAKQAEFRGLGLDADKESALARAAARREADYNYKRGLTPRAAPTYGAGWDKYRGPPGQAEALGAELGNDRPAAGTAF